MSKASKNFITSISAMPAYIGTLQSKANGTGMEYEQRTTNNIESITQTDGSKCQ